MIRCFALAVLIVVLAGCMKLSGHGTINDEGRLQGAVTIPVEWPAKN